MKHDFDPRTKVCRICKMPMYLAVVFDPFECPGEPEPARVVRERIKYERIEFSHGLPILFS